MEKFTKRLKKDDPQNLNKDTSLNTATTNPDSEAAKEESTKESSKTTEQEFSTDAKKEEEFSAEPQTEEEQILKNTNPAKYAKLKREEFIKYMENFGPNEASFSKGKSNQKQRSYNDIDSDFAPYITASEEKDGEVLTCDEQNSIQERKFLINGKLFGEYRKYENSILTERKWYNEGVLNGPYEIYKDSKLILKSEYLNGEPHGITYFYDMDGSIEAITSFREGKKHGLSLTFNSEGFIKRKEMYLLDQLHGQSITYHDNYNVFTTGTYLLGKKNGRWLMYQESGELYQISEYLDDVLIGSQLVEKKE